MNAEGRCEKQEGRARLTCRVLPAWRSGRRNATGTLRGRWLPPLAPPLVARPSAGCFPTTSDAYNRSPSQTPRPGSPVSGLRLYPPPPPVFSCPSLPGALHTLRPSIHGQHPFLPVFQTLSYILLL